MNEFLCVLDMGGSYSAICSFILNELPVLVKVLSEANLHMVFFSAIFISFSLHFSNVADAQYYSV